MKTFLLSLFLTMIAAPAVGQGSYPPTDFDDAGLPQPTDVSVVYRSGVARAKKMSLLNLRAGVSAQAVTVQCYGVDDTAAIDAGLASAQTYAAASGGAVLHISGNCLYSGAGIVNNPTSGQTRHLMIEGDGIRATSISFSACSNAQCILLGSQSAVGSGHNDGSGIRDLTLVGASGKDTLVIQNLEQFSVDNVYFYGGATAVTVTESRQGHVDHSTMRDFTVNGLKIIGEAHSDNEFSDLTIVSASATNGVVYDKTGTADAGGIYFTDVRVNGTLSGSGFQFTTTSPNSVFIFLTSCVADGNFAVAGLRFVKVINANLADAWSVNQYPSSNAPALLIDASSDMTVTGGTFYANTGATGADISLKNFTNHLAIVGARLSGPTMGVRVDSTSIDVDLRPSFISSGVLTNDATKLVPSTSARYASPPFLLTGTTTSTMLGFLQPGSSTAIYQRANSSGDLELVGNDASTILSKVAAAGGLTTNQVTNGGSVFTSTRATDTSPTGNFELFKNAAGSTLWQVDITGSLAAGTVPAARTSGFATVATSGSASDLGAGTLPSARLPNPSSSTLGGVQSFAAVSSQWIRQISTLGVPTASQPSFSDISGSVTDAQASDDLTINNTSSVTTTGAVTATGHYGVTTNGTATVSCTGTGTSPTAPTIAGSDSAFIIRMFTGTGSPGSTGTCTVTYGTAFATNQPVMVCMLVTGGSSWGNDATIQLTTESFTAPVLTWSNNVSGVATALTTSSSYKISCIVFKK